MEIVKKTKEYTIFKKRNERHAVQDASKKWINGDDKAKILQAEGLITLSKPSEKPAAEEAPSEEETPAE